jgi:hypothetical protein
MIRCSLRNGCEKEEAGLLSRRKFLAGTAGVWAAPALGQQKTRPNEVAEFGPQQSGEAQLLDPTAPFGSAVGQPGWRGRAPDDLVARARLALEGTLTNHIRDNGLPYFDVVINYATGEVDLPAKVTTWDHTSQTGRSVNAILCAREMTEDWKTGVENERKIRRVLLDDFREDGFNYMEGGVAMMHDQNRALLGLTGWYRHAEGERERQMLKGHGDKLVAAFIRTARKQGEAWDMPGMFYSPEKGFYDAARAPGKHGRTIMPLIEYGRTTGNSDAIKLAERYANHVLRVSDSFRFDEAGNFKDFGDEALHVHSVGATISGLILLGTELGRRDLVEQGRALYENGLKWIGNEFGWIPESNPNSPVNRRRRMLRQTTCEGCCVTDYIEAALYLARAGYPECWAEAECYVRNHLFESQITTVSWVKSKGSVDMQPRVLGSSSARSSPNRLFDLFHPSGPIGCCSEAMVRALHLAWRHGLEETQGAVWVNLLFDRDTPFARLETGLPSKGQVRVTMKRDSDLYIRVPDWARATLSYQPAEIAASAAWKGPFQRLPALKKGQTVEMNFRLLCSSREWLHSIMGITYRSEWLGDTVVSISPRGNCFPLYERTYLL